METSHIMNTLGSRPRPKGLDFAFIHMDAIRSDHIPYEGHLIREEGALPKVAKELLSLKYLHDLG